jgi:membrane protein YqaA with SNARE-associated domain
LETQQPANLPPEKKSFWNRDTILQIVSLVFVLGLSAVLIWQHERVEALASLGYAGIFIVSALGSASLVIPVPGLAFTVTFGAILNPFWVGLLSGLGATIGEITGYLLGYSGRMAIHETHPYSRMVGWMSKWGDLTIFLLALLPNPLFDIAGITAGMLKYPLWRFILLGAAGRIPKHILFAYLGHWGVGFFPN